VLTAAGCRLAFVLVGAVLGLGAGFLQSRGAEGKSRSFSAAVTAFDVRQALRATRAGTLAIALG